jgi:phage baseplate assembly protein W
MTGQFDRLGADLVVAPFLSANDASVLDLSTRLRPVLVNIAPGQDEAHDLDVIEGRGNLAHALLLRLLTPVGSLAPLGHQAYGSRLHELIGRSKTDANRNLCRAFVLEAVAQEPRVEPKAVALRFLPTAETLDSFVFELQVQPVAGGDPLALSLEVSI